MFPVLRVAPVRQDANILSCSITTSRNNLPVTQRVYSFLSHCWNFSIEFWQFTSIAVTSIAVTSIAVTSITEIPLIHFRTLHAVRIRIIWTKTMHYFLLIYFNNKSLHVSSRLADHHQEDQLCINSKWYSHALCWLAGGWIGMDFHPDPANRVDPPDEEHHACSKQVEAFYWNKLIENSASCWFVLYVYEYITLHSQKNIKNAIRNIIRCL